MFFFTTFWGFFPVFSAIFTFPQERAMLIKERASGMYRLSAYFMARTVGDLPLELVLPTLFVTIVYWMGGLKQTFLGFLLTLLVILYTVLVSQVCDLILLRLHLHRCTVWSPQCHITHLIECLLYTCFNTSKWSVSISPSVSLHSLSHSFFTTLLFIVPSIDSFFSDPRVCEVDGTHYYCS